MGTIALAHRGTHREAHTPIRQFAHAHAHTSTPIICRFAANSRRAGQGGRGRGQAGRGQAAGQGPAGAGAGREGGHGRAGQGQDEGREGEQQAGTGRQHRDTGASIGFKFFHHAILNRPACTQVKSGKAVGG